MSRPQAKGQVKRGGTGLFPASAREKLLPRRTGSRCDWSVRSFIVRDRQTFQDCLAPVEKLGEKPLIS